MILAVELWLVAGLLGCVIGTISDLHGGIDFEVRDAIWCAGFTLLGPITLVTVAFIVISKHCKGLLGSVLIRGRR